MTVAAISQINTRLADTSMKPLQKSLRRWTAGLLLPSVLGFVSGFGGLAISGLGIAGLVDPDTDLATLGTVFVAISFPFFILAAHCIDRVAAADKAVRIENCRRLGMKEEA